MNSTGKCLMVAALIVGASLLVRHEMNTARGDFDFAMTNDWSSADHAEQWQPVVVDEPTDEVTMDDVFHAAIAPRQTRTASAAGVTR